MSDGTAALRGQVSHFAATADGYGDWPDFVVDEPAVDPVDAAIDRALARSRVRSAPRRHGLPGVDPDDLPSLRDVADEWPAALGGPGVDGTLADVVGRIIPPRHV